MTDFRDPNYRDPSYRDPAQPMRDPVPAESQGWANSTWGWIAGLAVLVLILVFAFGTDGTDTAADRSNPPSTVGQGTTPPAPPADINTGAPAMKKAPMAPAPAPEPKSNP